MYGQPPRPPKAQAHPTAASIIAANHAAHFAATPASAKPSSITTACPLDSTMPNHAFTPDQYHHLLSLITPTTHVANQAGSQVATFHLSGNSLCFSSTSSQPFWILDTGASDHIVNSPSLFTSCHAYHSHSVMLPDGSVKAVTHIGTIQISPSLILKNVLCVPSFQYNLVSISKLVTDNDCFLTFSSHSCVIQD